ncbi:MAG TPA: cupredoxin domain-containing protein [Candidatus Dormibacteraeota bacterium]
MTGRAPAAALLGLGLGLAAAGCGTTAGPNPGGVQLRITARDLRFDPATAVVPAGSLVTVTLVNAGAVEHSFTAGSVHASADADPGELNTAPFTTPDSGTIAFHCRYHPQMTGTITVVPRGPSPTPAPGS